MDTNEEEYTEPELNCIREIIESMNKFNQVEILRILHKRSITLNENRYGVHINLSELNKEIIDELQNYIRYVNTQESTLRNVEKKKETFKNIYFTKDNKEIK